MDQAPENNLPPHTDAAHPDPAAGTGLRLSGDWTRERDALREQVAQCEADNTRLREELARITPPSLPSSAMDRYEHWQEQYGDWGGGTVPVPRAQMDALLHDYYTAVSALRAPALQAAYERAESELARVTEQWNQAEAHNNDLRAQVDAVTTWCLENQKAARNRAAQTGDDDWRVRQRVISEVWELVKPIS